MSPLQEMKLVNRAIRNRWEIPPDEMQKTMERAFHLRDNATDENTQMAAVRSIVSMVGQNQKDEHKVIDVRVVTRNDDLSGIALELGIDISLIEAAARDTDIYPVETPAERQPANNQRA